MNTITPSEAAWDNFVRQHPRGHILQLSAWGTLKSEFGWTCIRVALADGDTILAGAQILFRRLPARLGSMAYIPYAPVVDWSNKELTQQIMAAIHQTAKQHGAAFLKAESGFDVAPDDLQNLGFKLSPQTVQPPSTVILDLDDEDAIQKRMNQMTRRNIRKSAKQDVDIRFGTRADVDSFNAILNETGSRNEFGVHEARYYERVYELFVPQGDAVLMIGSYDQVDLAGVFIFKLGTQAWYLYGASSNKERGRMAPFGVQWQGIQWAMAQGCQTYDLYGIPDEDEATLEAQFQEREDGLWGVYRNKRGWGGRVARTVGAWDYVYNRPIYSLYQLALRILRRTSN